MKSINNIRYLWRTRSSLYSELELLEYKNYEIKCIHFPGIRTLLLSNSRDDFGDVWSSSELDLTKILGYDGPPP